MQSINEQETVINFQWDSDTCSVYTSDSTVIMRLDNHENKKLAAAAGKEEML